MRTTPRRRGGPYRHLARIGIGLCLTVPLSAGAAACSNCSEAMCMQPGVYLLLGGMPKAVAAQICVDTACKRVDAIQGDVSTTGRDAIYALQVQDPGVFEPNQHVNVDITVLDAKGDPIAHLREQRKVPGNSASTCSPCPVLTYQAIGGALVHWP